MSDATSEPGLTALVAGRRGVVVRLSARPGGRLALLDAVNRYIDDLHEEPGTEMFVLAVDPDDDDIAWLYEWFRDEDAEVEHRRSRPFERFMSDIGSLLAQAPGVLRIDPIRMHLHPRILRPEASELPDGL